MAENEDDSSKTEEPSQKKLDEARKKGQMVSSREINHFFMILALTFFVMALAPGVGKKALALLAPFVTRPDMLEVTGAGIMDVMREVLLGVLLFMAIPVLFTFIGAIAPAIVQKKWVFSTEQMKPKFDKLSPMKGFGRLFGMKGIIEFLKNMLKVSVVAVTVTMVALPYKDQLPMLLTVHKADMLAFAQTIAGKMLIATCIILFLLSIGDYLYQRFSFMKQMRMTKQEVKEEYKQQEGDPHIRGKLKAIRREKARQRMMANVPNADVVITNPTHYAVALQYDAATMPAPKVIAKGTDDVAGRIRDLATSNRIPIVRNPPLARILYDTTDIDEDVPIEHYAAVAKVIGYVYKLKGKTPAKSAATKPKPSGPGGKKPITIEMPQPKKK